MAQQNELEIWQSFKPAKLPAHVTEPEEITGYAKQLSKYDKIQIVQSFQSGHYEMVVNFVWTKAMAALKRELGSLGMQFLGEMLNKLHLTDDDDVLVSITDQEAVRLAQELGIVSSTEAMRLRHTHETVAHFFALEASDIEDERLVMEKPEAIMALITCVKNILCKPKIEVATKFAEFRKTLETHTLNSNDNSVTMLLTGPYFFQKLTVSILLSVIKSGAGAKLEHALANLNLLLPLVWKGLRETEKWQVGHAYAELFSAGKSTAMSGIKEALIKVKGFDFVPENLRSDAFVKAAENIIKAHEGINNFYNEPVPVKTLSKLGSTIPVPAFAICASAILAVRLGNHYGVSWEASSIAEQLLDTFTPDRWQYYLNQCLAGDIRILSKFESENPRTIWCFIVKKYGFLDLSIKDKNVNKLLAASKESDMRKFEAAHKNLLQAYYNTSKK